MSRGKSSKLLFLIPAVLISVFLQAFETADLHNAAEKYSHDTSCPLEKAVLATVFIVTKENYFDQVYGKNPGFFYKGLRPFYDFWLPSSFFHASGFIVSPQGHVVTNAHVIKNATEILVFLQNPDIRMVKASLVGKDLRSDLAVLQIENEENLTFPCLSFGDSEKSRIGEAVMAIGTPQASSLEATVTRGIVSAKNRNFAFLPEKIQGYLQIDASLNQGNSGGAVINQQAEVIGISNAVFNHLLGVEGIGLAIPSNIAKPIVDQLIAKGKVSSHGYLGIKIHETMENAFDMVFMPKNRGVLITNIDSGSPAEKAGLKKDDLILKLNGAAVKNTKDFKNYFLATSADSPLDLTVKRKDKIFQLTVFSATEKENRQRS